MGTVRRGSSGGEKRSKYFLRLFSGGHISLQLIRFISGLGDFLLLSILLSNDSIICHRIGFFAAPLPRQILPSHSVRYRSR